MIVDCSNKYSVIDRYDHKVHTDYDVTADKKGGGGGTKEKWGDGKMCTLRKSTG